MSDTNTTDDSTEEEEYDMAPSRGDPDRPARGEAGVNPESDVAGEDDEGFVEFDEVTFSRGEQGELQPETEYVEELGGKAKARPATKGHRDNYIEPFADPDGEKDTLTNADLAFLFDSRLEKPDLTNHPRCPDDEVTPEFVEEDMPQSMQDGCFIAILLASKEYDLVRLMRNDLKESEIEMAVRQKEMDDESKNERRKRRRREA